MKNNYSRCAGSKEGEKEDHSVTQESWKVEGARRKTMFFQAKTFNGDHRLQSADGRVFSQAASGCSLSVEIESKINEKDLATSQ